MSSSEPARDQVEGVFAQLHGALRLAALYPPRHPHIQRAQQSLLDALSRYLEGHGVLELRFLGDLLIAGGRILPRESLMCRRFLEVTQTERHIGGITFHRGVTESEVETLIEILAGGAERPSSGATEPASLVHVRLEPPARAEEQTSEVMARRAYFGAVEVLRTVEAGILRGDPITADQLSSLRMLTSAILEQILSDPSLVLRLANIKSHDEYTLYHSVNVCVLSISIGTVMGLSEAQLRELAIAAILHDLGKITVPREILERDGGLSETELEVLRRYPVRGAEMLSRTPGFNRIPMIVAFEHQLRHDRGGYPALPPTWDVHPFSEIVGVADAYDFLTSLRHHLPPVSSQRALAVVSGESGRAHHPDVVRVLERIVSPESARGIPPGSA